jgi:hypothetical protein
VEEWFALYVTSQVFLFGSIAVNCTGYIRVNAAPAFSRRLCILFIAVALAFVAIALIHNVRGRSDIQTPLAIGFFVFDTDTQCSCETPHSSTRRHCL